MESAPSSPPRYDHIGHVYAQTRREDPLIAARSPKRIAGWLGGRTLSSGAWDRRHGHLRALESFDAGLRLITNNPPEP